MVFVRLATGPPKKPPGPNRPVIQYGLLRAVKSNGAVSPATRTMASVAPVMSPPRAALEGHARRDLQSGAPIASPDSRSSLGTRLRMSSVALAFIMLPVMARTTEDILNLVPNELRESGLAMGAPLCRSRRA